MKLRIAILGCRGIPNRYGGFEKLAEQLAPGLVHRGHEVTVYNSHTHPVKDECWNGVRRVFCFDPEQKIGTAGQFVYDYNCIRHASREKYHVVLFLGYTSSSLWKSIYPSGAVIINHMDGMEWQRAKYSRATRGYLKLAEKLAVKGSHFQIADSVVIRDYLKSRYGISAGEISYGADIKNHAGLPEPAFGLQPSNYIMAMARMEPENNLEMILEGYCQSKTEDQCLIIGNTATKHGRRLLRLFGKEQKIIFAGAEFNENVLESLKRSSRIYFHGHSTGGTNPSLIEAMASGCFIAAHNNPFNRSVLEANAAYFQNAREVAEIITNEITFEKRQEMIDANLEKVRTIHNWNRIINEYDSFLKACYQKLKQ